ncbi:MAG: hypothetical protein U0Q19_23390 [Kineosporiaceae bacterium]
MPRRRDPEPHPVVEALVAQVLGSADPQAALRQLMTELVPRLHEDVEGELLREP